MAVEYSWKVTGLKTSTVGSANDVVVQTYWEKIGTENGVEGKFSGATPFSADKMPAGTTFIPFAQLKESDVLNWIQAEVTGSYEAHVNEQIQKKIDEQKSPVVEATLPWAK